MSNGEVVYPDLRGKRVLITGASGGLGAAMARTFGRQGARVLVHYRTRQAGAEASVAAVREAGGEAAAVRADLRSERGIDALYDYATAHWGGIDILVNNAGVVLKASVRAAGAEYFDDTLNINLRAPYLLTRRVAAEMIERGSGGVILHNSSIHARNSVQNFSAYAASKAALEAMARVMALEWAPHGIRVNCIAPGVVPVERTAQALGAASEQWLPHIPAGRYGKPEEIAAMTAYLASAQAAWVTGQSFVVDGGMLARTDMPRRPEPPLPPAPDPVEEP